MIHVHKHTHIHTYVRVYNRKADIISRFWQTLFRIFPRVQISCSLPTTAASDCRASFLPLSQFAQLTFFLALNTCKSCLPFLPDRLPICLNSGNYNKTTTKKAAPMRISSWEYFPLETCISTCIFFLFRVIALPK